MTTTPLELTPLTAISPTDGRYAEKTTPLRTLFSEYGLIRQRVHIEIKWLNCLISSRALPHATALSAAAQTRLEQLVKAFDCEQAQQVKAFEAMTNHDVKAVEHYLIDYLKKDEELIKLIPYLHFSATSEDINNLAWGLILKEALDQVVLPRLTGLTDAIGALAQTYADTPMLARTHGQPASPTTVGKEFANVAQRLREQSQVLAKVPITGKFGGAVGNFNAHYAACPDFDWLALAAKFVHSLGLQYMPCTTQIEPHDRLAEMLDAMRRISHILTDLSCDVWGYISLGYFVQQMKHGEVGSSTMPHKVNPIDFENAEGNLGLSAALAGHLSAKLPVSRWQRDLSDSTTLRSLGMVFAYLLIALDALERGLGRIKADKTVLQNELDAHWEVLGEALQTVLRKHGVADAYEQIKQHTRGRKMNRRDWQVMIKAMPLPDEEKNRLLELTPADYTGHAAALARRHG